MYDMQKRMLRKFLVDVTLFRKVLHSFPLHVAILPSVYYNSYLNMLIIYYKPSKELSKKSLDFLDWMLEEIKCDFEDNFSKLG